jgi:hypothetical protein
MSEYVPDKPARLVPLSNGVVLLSNDYQRRPCGCTVVAGIRLDSQEPACVLLGCRSHRDAAVRVVERMRAHPPCATPAAVLMLAMLDQEVGNVA